MNLSLLLNPAVRILLLECGQTCTIICWNIRERPVTLSICIPCFFALFLVKRSDGTVSFVLSLFCSLLCCTSYATDVSYDGRAIVINDERRILISGAIHYPRSTPEMWPDLIQKAKDGGLNTIETYVFWNGHEPQRRQYNFEERYDLIRFVKTIQEAGLFAVLRVDPYICAEWNYGGLPVWLHQIPGVQVRTDNLIFKNEMQNFSTLIMDMLKREKLFAPQGGPIIIAQIENEYGNWHIGSMYGEAGKRYIQWCANLAESFQIGVPWIMCQQPDAPAPMIDTCNGFYCDNFYPHRPNTPKMWTENWVGWGRRWGAGDSAPHRQAEEVAFATARFFQRGGTFENYYMYHGGTNFGRTSGGPYITTKYDYAAPIDEYGNLNQPKWGHLKQLHTAIKSMDQVLLYGENSTIDYGNGISATIYRNNNGTSGCFLSNTNDKKDTIVTFQGNNYTLPARSVSILPDCKGEVFNTAKVTTQTSVMVKRPKNATGQLQHWNWTWRPEKITDTLHGIGPITAQGLVEQILITGDASDYLWYMTSVKFSENDPDYKKNMTLRVNTTGHGLHAYFNEKLVGSKYAPSGHYQFVFEAPVQVKPGTNYLALLSATVGLANYGAYYDITPTGIVGGPVQLILNETTAIDLSAKQWTYKIGLNGETSELYSDKSKSKWYTDDLPINRMMTWYKAIFDAPQSQDPVVVDLQGMGKGEAWVNGNSLGRYWANATSPTQECVHAANCTEPSQRWYHVPWSFLKSGDNILILFEELGGNPTSISFQTVTIGTACASVMEVQTLELSCSGVRTISKIEFASYGDAQGTCGSFQKSTCSSEGALPAVQKACLGKFSCSIEVSDANLGPSNCSANISNKLVVQAAC